MAKRLALLRSYAWSSYCAYAGYITGPNQLSKDEVLGCFEGEVAPEQRKALRKFTESSIREGVETDQFFERIRYGVLLGSQEWTAKMRLLMDGDERVHPALQAARRKPIGFAVAEEFGESWEELSVRHGHPARALAIVLCRRHTSLTLSEIGARLGGSDYAAVSQAQKRMEKKLLHDPVLAVSARRIAKHLPKVEC